MLREEEKLQDINLTDFEKVFTPEVRQVISIIRQYGFDLRVVGGAVRDFLRNKPPRDIDFATDADPSELIYMFNKAKILTDATGIGHGTVKAQFGDDKVDITSISYKIEPSDEKLTIIRNRSWEEDALNRDLTINSMSIDLNGTIHDYTNGISDLDNSIIRFNKDTINNIQHDPHLIMRWFKALGYFDNPKWPHADWLAVKSNMRLLRSIKDEDKTARELQSIMTGRDANKIIKIMCQAGADRYLDLTCDF